MCCRIGGKDDSADFYCTGVGLYGRFGKIQKVYSIWICPDPVKKHRNGIFRYHTMEETVYGTSYIASEQYDLAEVVIINLGDAEEFESEVTHMCNLSAGLIELGEARGMESGQQLILMLMQQLFLLGRYEDAQRATDDSEYRSRLLEEFNLI